MKKTIIFHRHHENIKLPTRGTDKSAGIDFYCPLDIDVQPNSSLLIDSGLRVKLPDNKALVFLNKSSIASGLNLIVGAQVVDEDYQGLIKINLINLTNKSVRLQKDQKIIQGLVISCDYEDIQEALTLESLYDKSTERGEGGFGSTEDVKFQKLLEPSQKALLLSDHDYGKEYLQALDKVLAIRKERRLQYQDLFLNDTEDFLMGQIKNKLQRYTWISENYQRGQTGKEKQEDCLIDMINYALFLINNKFNR